MKQHTSMRAIAAFIMLAFSISCTLPTISFNSPSATAQIAPQMAGNQADCGNGSCDGPENNQNCPADCPAAVAQPQTQATTTVDGPAVVYLGIMVHLEGWDDAANQKAFDQHAALVREYADLFEKYGAKLTWESKELTAGIIKWGDNVLLEMQQRGHGVGLHADVGGSRKSNCRTMANELSTMKSELEGLGVRVRHASGITSHCDWVSAAADAGFEFATGVVAYGLMSLPEAERPAQFRNCPSPKDCHQPYPVSLAERMHPWRANTGNDWIKDNPSGRLVIIPESGGLAAMQEMAASPDGSYVMGAFESADVDAFFTQIDQAVSLADPEKVNTFYVSWSLGKPLDKALLEQWLQRLQPYVQAGTVQWKTLPEMYDAYLAWEQTQGR